MIAGKTILSNHTMVVPIVTPTRFVAKAEKMTKENSQRSPISTNEMVGITASAKIIIETPINTCETESSTPSHLKINQYWKINMKYFKKVKTNTSVVRVVPIDKNSCATGLNFFNTFKETKKLIKNRFVIKNIKHTIGMKSEMDFKKIIPLINEAGMLNESLSKSSNHKDNAPSKL